MKGPTEKYPYQSFGQTLKNLREKHAKSQIELSGAIEVDINKLEDFEQGKARPSADILALIIQHFNLQGNDADKLWELAGYDNNDESYLNNDEDINSSQTKSFYVTPQDLRIVYTDIVQIMVNNYGVVINFLQGAGLNNTPLAVSRIGMSKEHAKSLLDLLDKTLKQSEDVEKKQSTPKRLPPQSSQKQE